MEEEEEDEEDFLLLSCCFAGEQCVLTMSTNTGVGGTLPTSTECAEAIHEAQSSTVAGGASLRMLSIHCSPKERSGDESTDVPVRAPPPAAPGIRDMPG